MDSKAVIREVRIKIWPILKGLGFQKVSAKTAWRHREDTIDVFTFSSFNRYNADVLRVTTFSFAVSLGCYLCYVPPQWPTKRITDGRPFPSVPECPFRGALIPTVYKAQKQGDIWAVDESGSNLSWCLNDVANQVPEAIAWFDRLSRREEVLRILCEDQIVMPELWGFGRLPSPHRSYLTGYVAMAIGDDDLANRAFEKAVESGHYTHLFASVEGARYRAAA